MRSRLWISLLLGVTTGLCGLSANPPVGLPPLPWMPPPHLHSARPPIMLPMQPLLPQPPLVPPPLLYLRFEGPAGSRIAFFRGHEPPQKLDLPAVVGFRPGYQYRAALENLPGRPGVVYFPTFDVRGSMVLSHKLRNADFPASVVFREEELDRVAQGSLLHKVIVLERPEHAVPASSTPQIAVEIAVQRGDDPLSVAREHGLPLATLYLGQRKFSAEEMAVVPGTVYLPGDKTLPPPAAPPLIPPICYPLVDPSLHTVPPSEYMTVYDGGDSGAPAGLDGKGRLRGVDPSDTVAEYVDSKGRKRVAVSNRVALCIPRFILLTSETFTGERATVHVPTVTVARREPNVRDTAYRVTTHIHKTQLEQATRQERPSGTNAVYGTTVTGSLQGTAVRATVAAPATLDGHHVPLRSEAEDLPLLIIKWPDRHGVLPGELLTFFLKYSNQGKQPINDVVVVDNLTPRFEYVAGSSKTDRDGTFTLQPNSAGSHLLRWEFTGPLLPGESGMISFNVKVR